MFQEIKQLEAKDDILQGLNIFFVLLIACLGLVIFLADEEKKARIKKILERISLSIAFIAGVIAWLTQANSDRLNNLKERISNERIAEANLKAKSAQDSIAKSRVVIRQLDDKITTGQIILSQTNRELADAKRKQAESEIRLEGVRRMQMPRKLTEVQKRSVRSALKIIEKGTISVNATINDEAINYANEILAFLKSIGFNAIRSQDVMREMESTFGVEYQVAPGNDIPDYTVPLFDALLKAKIITEGGRVENLKKGTVNIYVGHKRTN